MGAKRHERSAARSAALQLLYTSELQNRQPSELLDQGLCLLEDGELTDFALMLVRGVESNRDTLDTRLEATSENWSVARMPIVDRCILRLAAYEMLYVDEVPISVSINEAVELAKVFGGEDESPRFVNGLLGRIARSLDADVNGANSEAVEDAVGAASVSAESASCGDGADGAHEVENPVEA